MERLLPLEPLEIMKMDLIVGMYEYTLMMEVIGIKWETTLTGRIQVISLDLLSRYHRAEGLLPLDHRIMMEMDLIVEMYEYLLMMENNRIK